MDKNFFLGGGGGNGFKEVVIFREKRGGDLALKNQEILSCYKTEILMQLGDQFVYSSICLWPNYTPVKLMLHRQRPHIGDQ
jgi:hypothetical protein